MPAPSSASGRILEFDGLRACAVLAVIAFHYTRGTGLAGSAARLGWMGVDLFFVLSGFLITSILLSARGSPDYFRTFYARRTLRILPVYYLLLGVYLIAALAWGGAQPWRYWGMHAAFLAATVEHFRSWNFPAPGFVYAGVTVLWSLSIEEQFYLLWAPVVRWLRPRGLWAVLAGAAAGAPLLRFLMHTRYFPEYRFFPARFDSLAWGAGLALAWRRWDSDRRRLGRWCLGMGGAAAALLAALLAATGGHRANLWFATLGYTLLAAVFTGVVGWTGARAGERARACRLLRLGPMRRLGTISYTTYLVHYPILLLAGAGLAGRGGLWLRDGLALAAALAVAGASWRWLEGPLLHFKDRWAPGERGGAICTTPARGRAGDPGCTAPARKRAGGPGAARGFVLGRSGSSRTSRYAASPSLPASSPGLHLAPSQGSMPCEGATSLPDRVP